MKIILATKNQNKVREVQELLPNWVNLVGLGSLDLEVSWQEVGATFGDNAAIKAHAVAQAIVCAVLADDSGLCVDSLNGEPGVYSSRYAGPQASDEENIQLLLRNLKHKKDRSAYFICHLTFIEPSGNRHDFSGRIDGTIVTEPAGSFGFGYDPIFKPLGFECTFAELNAQTKNKISHRAEAMKKLNEFLSSQE